MTVKEKRRKNWLKPQLHLWPFTSGTNADDVNYREEMKHKKMGIRGVPVRLLKTISAEPWRPKMYNTNHGWHLLTARVIVANNLHGEHCHHKQPMNATLPSVWTASACCHKSPYPRAKPVFPTVGQPTLKIFMVVLRLRVARKWLWGHKKRSFEYKAKVGELS